jgi:GAF domain-containing protein
MTIRPGGRPASAAATDPVTAGVDEVQYRLDDGPCLEAMRAGEIVSIDDTAWSTRWPEFEARAAAAGIRSCLAVPVQDVSGQYVSGQDASGGNEPRKPAIGVLSLYAREKAAFGDQEARRAEAFAERASSALAFAVRLASYADLNEQLRASLATRPVIDQALGIIIARENCSQAAAFAILRNASQNSNTKLRDLAARVVAGATGEPVQPPPFVVPGDLPEELEVSADEDETGDPSAAPTLG